MATDTREKEMDSDSDSEDEVFFGEVTEKELIANKKTCPRRTTIFYRRDSLVAFQKQEKSSNVLRDSMGNLFIQDSFETDEERSKSSLFSHKMSEESEAFQTCTSSVTSSVYETAAESLTTSETYEKTWTMDENKEKTSKKISGESQISSSCYESALETSPQINESFKFSNCQKITLRKSKTTFDFLDVKELDSSAEPSELESEDSVVVSESINSDVSDESMTFETKEAESNDEVEETIAINHVIEEFKEMNDEIEEYEGINDEIEESKEADIKIEKNEQIDDEFEAGEEIDAAIEENKEIDVKIEENKEIDAEIEENKEIDAEIEENKEIDAYSEGIYAENEEIDAQRERIYDETDNIELESYDSSDNFISCNAYDSVQSGTSEEFMPTEIEFMKNQNFKLIDTSLESAQTGTSEEFMPIEIELMKNENFKFIDTSLDTTHDLSTSSETSDSAQHLIHMTSDDSLYTPHRRSSIETDNRSSDVSPPMPKDEKNDKDCQTSFWYIAVDKKASCFIESKPKPIDNFVVPMIPPSISTNCDRKPPREIRKPTNFKSLSENRFKMPIHQGRFKTPEKKFGHSKYQNIVSPVANYIKGSPVVTPLISNVLSNSISTNQKKKPTFTKESKIPRIYQPLQPIVHRH